jgi:hypothetical protein
MLILNPKRPFIELPGRLAKNRKDTYQPVNAELRDDLRQWRETLVARGEKVDDEAPVLPVLGTPDKRRNGRWQQSSDLLAADRKAAGIPFRVKGKKLVFHSLRTYYITQIARIADAKTSLELGRHEDLRTHKRYHDVIPEDQHAAVGKLQPLRLVRPDADATGAA